MNFNSFAKLAFLLFLSGTVFAGQSLNVYKTETCGCCGKWVEHMAESGVTSVANNLAPEALNAKKESLGIKPEFQSCHVGVSEEGYVFEGHVPAYLVKRFLDEKPEGAIGLAVPGMPIGSPGMEMGERFQPYDVLMLKKDGSYEVYERVEK